MQQKILVTGGTGYIGSHTVVELIESGFEVLIVDSLENSFISVLDGIEKITSVRPAFVQLDLRDEEGVKELFRNHPDIKAVIHFAAYKAVGESVREPLKYYDNNLSSLVHLLRAMEENQVNNVVFSSSCTVYGEVDALPVTEQMPTKMPTSPYGNTKKISEEILRDVCHVTDLQCICLRYFNPVGAHASAYIGELPIGVPNNLIPYITQTAAGIREKVTVFGGDYPTPDGSCIRDYIHVVDVAKAHVIALKRLLVVENRAEQEFFNLGTGRGFSVLEILHAFEQATGQKVPYEIGPRRMGDIAAIYADTSVANQELNWYAVESLETMMRSAWAWQRRLQEQKA